MRYLSFLVKRAAYANVWEGIWQKKREMTSVGRMQVEGGWI